MALSGALVADLPLSGVLRVAGSSGGQCGACGRLFNDASNARKHFLRMHGERTDETCDVCGRRFGNRVAWASHLREAHGITQRLLKELECTGRDMLDLFQYETE